MVPVSVREWIDTDGTTRPALVWLGGSGWRTASTSLVGGGIGPCAWWVNAQVSRDYDEPDPVAHALSIATGLGLAAVESGGVDAGVVMLTAADVRYRATARDGEVEAVATVGLGLPVPAAAPAAVIAREALGPGTINTLVVVPAALTDAALVNAVVTATEAKTQALIEAAVPGTGTSSDAVCIVCRVEPVAGQPIEEYGGPRSRFGERIARAVHAAVAEGTAGWLASHPTGDAHRHWPAARSLPS